MGPAREPEFRQDVGQALPESGLLFIHRDETEQVASIPTAGLNDIQALQFFDNSPGGHLQSTLADLTLQ